MGHIKEFFERDRESEREKERAGDYIYKPPGLK
jgi:hypothetical protein